MTGGAHAMGMAAAVIVALAPLAARAGGEFTIDPAEMHAAKKAARSFRQPGGLARAMRIYCRASDGPRHAAAYTVLVERGAEAMPRLLDAIARMDTHPTDASLCSSDATRVAVKAVCDGHDDGDLYDIDRRPYPAMLRGRRAARRALVRALRRPGPRRAAALEVILGTRDCGERESPWTVTDIARDLVKQATPALVRMLAVPKLEMDALRALAMGGADAKLARAPLRARLADDRTLPLAAIALAPMGEDLHAVVPRLAHLLAGPHPATVVRALGAIGAPARPALPALAKLAARYHPPDCRAPMAVDALVHAIGLIGTEPGHAEDALPALEPLLPCPSYVWTVAKAMLPLGKNAGERVVAFLRDPSQGLRAREDAGRALVSARYPLSGRDRDLVTRIERKVAVLHPPVAQVPPQGPGPSGLESAGAALARCRDDAGLGKPPPVTGLDDKAAGRFSWCLDRYFCGPGKGAYRKILAQCCREAFGDTQPALCRE